MFRRHAFLAFLITGLLVPAAAAGAAVRTYFNPALHGKPVNVCLSGLETCGKPSADAWCRDQGYLEALTFERLPTSESESVFRQIKCFTPEQALATAAD